jgi:hypothetical protein
MDIGIGKARRSGVAMVALRRTHHLGRIGHWAEQCCAAGMASIHFTSVASNASVAPWGGTDARLGTNPFTCGVPVEGDEPIVLDMATSRLPVGKVRVAHNQGKPIVDIQRKLQADPEDISARQWVRQLAQTWSFRVRDNTRSIRRIFDLLDGMPGPRR